MEQENDFTHDDVLLPLAIAVVIDKKVKKPEMQSFYHQAQGLFDLFDLPQLEKPELLKWFKTRESDLANKLKGPRRNTLVLRALSRFKKDRDVEAIYDAMVSISVSDQEYVVVESELIKSAGAIWGFPRPPIKVDR